LLGPPTALFFVRMAGHQCKGRDRRRQRSGRNFEAGPMAVTGATLAARHFHRRRRFEPAGECMEALERAR
jgi:hypothetical protein